ncbi:MAG TPA: acylneuraminate cytidylyltransferase family protein [Candidatus Andersenbacteria bacterium]|nr:MAG: hypothetical protein A2854_04730 [Parcubacteria group bacterium RIFCSPHIGHO2_01_FULL_56_18]HLD26248.1 acylneuraminate cytidylyltransferase family protein [Candidatus Andersenbacteria bacterium]
MHVLAIIPARGGSKGIPLKNLALVAGKPLVAHSIEHALAAKLVTRVIVSTDHEEIKQAAVAAGADVPFLRPTEISQDTSVDLELFQHALQWLREHESYEPDVVVQLRPTAPYRQPKWIDEAVQLLAGNRAADSIRSVSEPRAHPYRIFRISPEGWLDPIMKHEHPAPHDLLRQQHPPMYHYNCVIDVTRPQTIFEKQSMTGTNIAPYIMNPDDVFDIDSPRDLELVRFFMEHLQAQEQVPAGG